MTTGKAFRTALTLAAVLCVAPVAKAAPVAVAQGTETNYTSAATITGTGTAGETVLDVHGTVNVRADVTLANGGLPFYVDLGSDPGDEGVLAVTNHNSKGIKPSGKGDIRIGNNGGGDKARLLLKVGAYSVPMRFRSLELCAAATTAADSFQAVSIGQNSVFGVAEGSIINNNSKPLEISFDYYNEIGGNATLAIETTATTGGLFIPRNGDIVLRSVKKGNDSTIIKFLPTGSAESASEISFFPADTGDLHGVVRTEGPGHVVIDLSQALISAADRKPFTWNLNAAKFEWNHERDFYIGRGASYYATLKVTADNALPFGRQTGKVVLRSTDAAHRPTLDLAGTTQRINGLKMDGNGGVVTNSAATEAVLVFGTGDADGEINMVVTNSAIRCEKVGAGTLTLNGGALNTLSGNAGGIVVNAATYVDTLAITNMTIGGDLSLLTVRENLSQYTLSDGAASNCVLPFDDVMSRFAGTAVKDGPGFVTYMTPEDADGANLSVNAGVLRFGGVECTNKLWRLSLKKARNDGHTYTITNADESVSSVFVNVGFGNINLFTPNGVGAEKCTDVSWYTANAAYGNEARVLANAYPLIFSKNQPFQLSGSVNANFKNLIVGGGQGAKLVDSIFGGTNNTWNAYDVNCTNETMTVASGIILDMGTSAIFTNAVLDPANPATWEVFTWGMKTSATSAARPRTSYAMRRPVNWNSDNRPCVTDWLLESSADGVNWVTMDERENQRPWRFDEPGSSGFHQQFNHTYNNHVPYLFKSRNADWRFTDFGKVSVAAGAKLDLSELREENIAFNALEVDCAAGAGTITHFAPAAGGALYLENLTQEQMAASKFKVPVTIENWIAPENLSGWSVYVNGTLSKIRWLEKSGDDIYVHQRKALIILVQ